MNKFFMPEGNEGGGGASEDIQKKLDRLEYLEGEFKKIIRQRDDAKDQKRKEEEAKLLEEKKYQELLSNKDKELEEHKSKVKTFEEELGGYKSKVGEYETYITQKKDSIKTELGDKWLDSMTALPLADLEKLAQTLKIPDKTVDTDKNKGSAIKDLTADEKQQAAKMGLTEEGFLLYKQKLNERKNKNKEFKIWQV